MNDEFPSLDLIHKEHEQGSDTLHIWTLADTRQRGTLDLTDFTIALHYAHGLMDLVYQYIAKSTHAFCEKAYHFFAKSRLSDTVLAKIWDLYNITKTGHLTKNEFIVGLALIRRKNIDPEMPIPEDLPLSIVPPSLRHHVVQPKSAHSGGELLSWSDNEAPLRREKLEKSRTELENPTSSNLRVKQDYKLDTFDFDDMWKLLPTASPAQTRREPAGIQDLIGLDSDLWTKSTTPKQDQLYSLESKLQKESKAVKDLQTERLHLDSETSRVEEMHVMMRQRLSNLKYQQERSKVHIGDYGIGTLDLRMAITVSKRELEVAQADKTAFLEALKNGREESLELKVTLQRNQDEVTKLKTDLEARMRILGLDPWDYPSTLGIGRADGGGVGSRVLAEIGQNTQNMQGPQSVKEDLLVSTQARNPQFREPEPAQRVRGPQDHGAWQDEMPNKPVRSQPWHLLAQQESLAREQ
ncbi:hypothetical protein BGW39_007794 [Mortierella sp. 14UC]|nr:hypothetical protein BGW39_007794 [Mortierella sp. 14UC]